MPDIDIDLPSSFDAKQYFPNIVQASLVKNGELKKHNCGYYFQAIATDPITNVAAIPYEEAEVLGYFKVDFLHLSALDCFNSKAEIRALIKKTPSWELLQQKSVVQKLSQVHRHYELLCRVKPKTVQELSDVIALIRPGKKHLLELYIADREHVRNSDLYNQVKDGYTFRKSHAIAYALTIVLQLHLIEYGIL